MSALKRGRGTYARLLSSVRTRSRAASSIPSPAAAAQILGVGCDVPPLPAFAAIDGGVITAGMGHVLEEFEARIADLRKDIASSADLSWAHMERLEAARDTLGRAFNAARHVQNVASTPEVRAAVADVLPRVVEASTRLGQDADLFKLYSTLLPKLRAEGAPSGRIRTVELALREAQHAGVGLPREQRQEFNDVMLACSTASQQFSCNVTDATAAYKLLLTSEAEVDGLPASVRAQYAAAAVGAGHAHATPDAGPWLVTLDAPSLRPFLQLSTRRDLREQVYRAYATRASSGQHDNTGLMASILSARQRMSRMLGYADYASLSTAEKMVGTPAAVWALLDKLHAVALPAAQREVAELTKFAQARGHAGSLAPYDTAYWINRHLEEHFGIDEEAVRQYFPLPAVMDGMFSTLSNVFNISWAELGGSQRPSVWHKDVHCYSVHEGSAPTHNNAIASFLFDPYARPATKNGGAWADECVGRTTNPLLTRGLPGGVRLPVAHLVCNGSAPVGGNPSLMTHNDVLTLWHEMGHGLQLMLTRVGEGNVAGISGIEWDAVELPSQFAEEFAFHPAVLKLMSSHVDTGEPLSDDLIARLRGARTHMAALNMLRQLFLASTDMALHSADRTPAFACDASAFACGFDPFALTRGMASTHTVIPPLPEDRFLCAFSHIFSGGYAAGYFSYKHAEVMAADAFAAFEEAGLVGKSPAEFSLPAVNAMGKRFRDTVLSLGGSVHPTQVFRSFRGREPSVEPLLRSYGLSA